MAAEILINSGLRETRVARLENGHLVELHIEHGSSRGIVGNIYKGKATRVLPGMQAAFVDIGLNRTGFLYVNKVLDPNKIEARTAGYHDEEFEDVEEDIDDAPEKHIEIQSISSLVREGESLLVQVIKDPMGSKGARLSGYVSIPGRYLVYLPNSNTLGISRRIENTEERSRLKKIVEKNQPKSGGIIVRTVAEGASEKALKGDMEYLIKLWGSVKKNHEKHSKPGLIHADFDLALRILRDRVSEDVDRIIVDDLQLYRKMNKFVQSFLPRFKKRIELYKEPISLFEHFGIESDINRSISRKVWLKSGGYIVVDETEALTAIDVNTGRFVGKRNLEDTIFQTNMEAVKEIAYQIRLRNLGGIIVLDFIDMEKSMNKDRIYTSLLEELSKDPVRTNVLPVSEFGLIEMTRKRTQESLRKKLTAACQYCDGKGYVKSVSTIAYEILRECEKEAQNESHGQTLQVYCHPTISQFLTEEERGAVEELEKSSKKRLAIKIDQSLHLEEYEIFSKEN
ncbi:Rne/Rng family ribonuclease [bacterium]|nr:Rne/Rng family ribonuclease [bacterium]